MPSIFDTIRLRAQLMRNAIIARPGFRDWAARTPLVRRSARRHAREAFDLVAGFAYSQILFAAVTSGLLDALAKGPRELDTLATTCGLDRAGMERLVRATIALGLVEHAGAAGFVLGVRGVAIQADAGIVAMVRHHGLLYADLADPLALLAGSGKASLSHFWPYARDAGAGGGVANYSKLMAASQPMVAAQALAAFDFSRHRRLLDVGGGSGAFVAAVGAQTPRLHRAVFDLPDVVAQIADATVERVGGSFLHDALPAGHDLITLVRIVHDHGDAAAATLLAAARAALPAEGTLLIVEPMAGLRGHEAMGDGYFGMYLLAMGSGRPRRPDEIRAMLGQAGFRRTRLLATPLPMVAQVIVARP